MEIAKEQYLNFLYVISWQKIIIIAIHRAKLINP
jgi:hypothetical protein